MNIGETFVNVNAASPSHLWFVCTTPTSADEVVIFNLTTLRLESDESCRVSPGEHPFVAHESVIEYSRGQLVVASFLDQIAGQGQIEARARASDALIDRIRKGALSSMYAPQKVQSAIRVCPWQPRPLP